MKKWWESLTIWFNAVMLNVFAFADFFIAQLSLVLPQMRDFIPADIYGWLFVASTIGNIALRFKTTSGVSVK